MLGKTIFPCTILCSSLGYDTCNTEHVRPVIRLLLANRRHCLQAVIVSKPDDIFGQSTCPWKEVSRQLKTVANKCAIAHTRLLISVSLQIGFLHAQTSLSQGNPFFYGLFLLDASALLLSRTFKVSDVDKNPSSGSFDSNIISFLLNIPTALMTLGRLVYGGVIRTSY